MTYFLIDNSWLLKKKKIDLITFLFPSKISGALYQSDETSYVSVELGILRSLPRPKSPILSYP